MICKNLNKWSSIVVTLTLAVSMCFVLPAINGYAAACTFTSNVNGNWNAAIWNAVGTACSTYPGQTFSGDTVIIANGRTVTLNVSPANAIASLQVGQGASGILTIGSSNTVRTLNVTGGVTINNGATITPNNPGAVTAHVLNIGGNFTNNGTFTSVNGNGRIGVTLNGTTAQAIGGTTATTFYNMTVNNAAGVSLGINATVSNVLTLTSGDISTGNYIMEVSSSCATGISGGSATRYVFGNLRLHYPTAGGTTTCTFPIGDATTYAPVTVAMVAVTSTLANSTLQARTDTPDHADTTAGTSGIDKDYSVNRTWTLTPGGSLTFTSYNPTFNFVAGDIDSGATTANFIIGRKSGAWTYPTVSAANPLNTAATGITQANGFGEFAIGETTSIFGTVFEDINYGGGAGRSLAASSGAPVANARVELYSSAGAFLTSTTTNASGVYRFARAGGTYTVRVASNGTTGIRSTRTGGAACATCVPVQTYRTDAPSGTANPITDHVGGEVPTKVDAGDNTTSATLASLNTAAAYPQSITTVVKGAANVTGVDFGFNFDTIVSIRDTGQGSLRQFITNANALGGEGSLTQTGQTSGQETSIFMIPHGTSVPGHNTGYTDQLTSGGANNGAAVITIATVLDTISGNNTSLDATTQTANVGNTNSGTVGTGGTVGTMAQTLQPFDRPEVVILASPTGRQLTASGTTVIIKGLAIANGGITVGGSNSQVRDCLSGMNADGTVTTVYGATYGISIGAGPGIIIHHNYVKVNNSSIRNTDSTNPASATIEYNEVDSPAGTPGGGHTLTYDGILIVGTATNVTIQYNLVRNQRGGGLEFGFTPPGTVISGTSQGNTISGNGFTSAGARSAEPLGVVAYALSASSALIIKQNVITGNAGPGLVVIAASGVTITENSIFSNGSLATDIGIDLNTVSGDPNTYTAQGVTLNDSGDGDTGPNNLLNYPIIESATISGGNLILMGWARPNSVIEFFIVQPDASGGFGSGRTYRTTLTEGVSDTDATSSTYGPGAINGIAQGTDTTNRFQFTIAIPSGVAIGTVLTATATLAGNTSEFSGNATVVGVPVLTVLKSADKSSVAPGETITYTVVITNTGTGTATNVIATDLVPTYTTYVANSTRLNGITVAADGVTSPLTAGLLIDDNLSRGAGVAATGILPPHSGSIGVATVIFSVTVN